MTDTENLIERANRYLIGGPRAEPPVALIRDLRDALAERAAMPTRADVEAARDKYEAEWPGTADAMFLQGVLKGFDAVLALFARNQTDGEKP
jgi:hypothetical protein